MPAWADAAPPARGCQLPRRSSAELPDLGHDRWPGVLRVVPDDRVADDPRAILPLFDLAPGCVPFGQGVIVLGLVSRRRTRRNPEQRRSRRGRGPPARRRNEACRYRRRWARRAAGRYGKERSSTAMILCGAGAGTSAAVGDRGLIRSRAPAARYREADEDHPDQPDGDAALTLTMCPVTPIRATEYVRASARRADPHVLDDNPPVPSKIKPTTLMRT